MKIPTRFELCLQDVFTPLVLKYVVVRSIHPDKVFVKSFFEITWKIETNRTNESERIGTIVVPTLSYGHSELLELETVHYRSCNSSFAIILIVQERPTGHGQFLRNPEISDYTPARWQALNPARYRAFGFAGESVFYSSKVLLSSVRIVWIRDFVPSSRPPFRVDVGVSSCLFPVKVESMVIFIGTSL